MKRILIKLILIFFISVIFGKSIFCLEPKLLWKKYFNGLNGVALAKISGDIAVRYGKMNRITVLNKEGKTFWQWGPSLKRVVTGMDINYDGKYIVFHTDYNEDMRDIKGHSDFMYYWKIKDGIKEISKFEEFFTPYISPDGNYVFLCNWGEYGGPSSLVDKYGKKLWETSKLGFEPVVIFSADSICFAVTGDPIYLFNVNGTSYRLPDLQISSLSENCTYIGLEAGLEGDKNLEGIYNKNGNLLFKGQNTISGNGKVVVKQFNNKIELYKFPEKIKTGEFPIVKDRWDSHNGSIFFKTLKISYDGKICVVYGRRTDTQSNSNFFTIDIQSKRISEIPVLKSEHFTFYLTLDGKYFVFVDYGYPKEKNLVYFYKNF